MGEYPLVDCIRALSEGQTPETMEIPGGTAVIRKSTEGIQKAYTLPSFADVRDKKKSFKTAFNLFYQNRDLNPLIQPQDTRSLVQFPRRC